MTADAGSDRLVNPAQRRTRIIAGVLVVALLGSIASGVWFARPHPANTHTPGPVEGTVLADPAMPDVSSFFTGCLIGNPVVTYVRVTQPITIDAVRVCEDPTHRATPYSIVRDPDTADALDALSSALARPDDATGAGTCLTRADFRAATRPAAGSPSPTSDVLYVVRVNGHWLAPEGPVNSCGQLQPELRSAEKALLGG